MQPRSRFALSAPAVRARALLIAAVALVLLLPGRLSAQPPRPHDPAIAAYVGFLQRPQAGAVDYVLSLFDEADVVVLGERVHDEVTQYELVFQLVSDPRFVERAGHVFTEIGSRSSAAAVDGLLRGGPLPGPELDARLLAVYRDYTWNAMWQRENMFHFLRRVHGLNQTLPAARKVRVHPVDLALRWDTVTAESYTAWRPMLRERDRSMAEEITRLLGNLPARDGARPKALVIMNYRHAFPHLTHAGTPPQSFRNAAGFLMEAYPGRVRNVMLNTLAARLPARNERDIAFSLVQGGRWDAAFAAVGNPEVGFDFRGSPFGGDDFDLWPLPNDLRYQDVFTGFVFYRPLEEHRQVNGIPGLVEPSVVPELRRRHAIAAAHLSAEQVEAMIGRYGVRTEKRYQDALRMAPPIAEQIARWLR